MKRLRIVQVNNLPVRSLLEQAESDNGLTLQDEQGRGRFRVIPYTEATPAEKQEALADLRKLQKEVGKSMRARGVAEGDVEQLLLEDD